MNESLKKFKLNLSYHFAELLNEPRFGKAYDWPQFSHFAKRL